MAKMSMPFTLEWPSVKQLLAWLVHLKWPQNILKRRVTFSLLEDILQRKLILFMALSNVQRFISWMLLHRWILWIKLYQRCYVRYNNRKQFLFIKKFQRFNGLNWEAVEDSSRKLAANRNIVLDVYTGTFGTLSLNDYYKNPKDIYLYVNGLDRRIPIPRLYYKVLINKADGTGIVLIGVNNPHLTLDEIKKDFIICTDVSDMISYVNWKKDDISRGYSYACDVNEFLKIVPHFAEINVKSLLI